MPIEEDIQERKNLTLMKQLRCVSVYRLRGVSVYRMMAVGREIIILEGDDRMTMEGALKNYLKALKKVLLTEEEPMINIAGFGEEKVCRLVTYPRRKHRPDAFFKEREDRFGYTHLIHNN